MYIAKKLLRILRMNMAAWNVLTVNHLVKVSLSRIAALEIQLLRLTVIRRHVNDWKLPEQFPAKTAGYSVKNKKKLPDQNGRSGLRPFLYNTLYIQMVKSYCLKQKKHTECVPGRNHC